MFGAKIISLVSYHFTEINKYYLTKLLHVIMNNFVLRLFIWENLGGSTFLWIYVNIGHVRYLSNLFGDGHTVL